MISLIFLWLVKRPLIAASLTALVVGGGGYTVGKWIGARQERAQVELRNKQAQIDQLNQRIEIDEDVNDLDAANLCRELGGVFDNGQCS